MPLQGFAFDQVPRAPHLTDQPLLEALGAAIPDAAVVRLEGAEGRDSGAERHRTVRN
jgi:hypothetical protein